MRFETEKMTILMIRPVRFGYNTQTAVNNAFQEQPTAQHDAQTQALKEFESFVEQLRSHDIDVLVVDDTPHPHTPDSIFPNNWVSFHDDTMVLYPMFAENRRLERKPSVFEAVSSHFAVAKTIDYTDYEAQGRFLEGTGSFVLDRDDQVAYACLSPRTDEGLFNLFCEQLGYKPVVFQSFDQHGIPIYHTNVMMCVADQYAVINLDSIPESDRKEVVAALEGSGKTIIPISHEQMNRFAGNMLQVSNRYGKKFLVMSSQAYHALTDRQIKQLTSFNPIIHSPLDTIEKNGGGSARCMMAEVFLPLSLNDPQ